MKREGVNLILCWLGLRGSLKDEEVETTNHLRFHLGLIRVSTISGPLLQLSETQSTSVFPGLAGWE